MEIAEKQIMALETRMEKVEGKLDSHWDVLAQINEKLKKLDTIETGLFGNEILGHEGVIKRQADLQRQIDSLNKEIEHIRQVNREQDVAISAKNNVKNKWMEIGRMLVQIIIQTIAIIAILKGIMGVDTFLKIG